MKEYKTFGERFLARREELRMTQEELADKAGITRMAISKIELGMTKKPRVDNLFALAKALKVSPDWLASGKGTKEPDHHASPAQSHLGSAKRSFLSVPLVPWTALTHLLETGSLSNDEYPLLPCPVLSGKRTFAVNIDNSALEPRFEIGDTLYVDPDQTEPKEGKFVILSDLDNKTFYARQIQIIDNSVYLKVINPDYPADLKFIKMTPSHCILGTAVSHVKPV
jgi:transcriptional regulator with XRE-family HTH domain